MGGSSSMVTKAQALPGRAARMLVPATHYVLKGNKMEAPFPAGLKTMVVANGCFWGSEKGIWRLPGGGIYSTAVGYAAGFTPNPSYEEACSGMTGHTEAVQVVYDPAKISFVDIIRWFWEAHDPTSGMGQGNDRGSQYRSAAYWFDEEQKQARARHHPPVPPVPPPRRPRAPLSFSRPPSGPTRRRSPRRASAGR